MKATGIVRRMDDLGRVVIPKEIRRTMKIGEGTPLEIFIDKDGGIIFRKYSPVGELSESAQRMSECVSAMCGAGVAVSDRDRIVASAGIPKKDLLDKPVSEDLENIMKRREKIVANRAEGTRFYAVSGDSEPYTAEVIVPICAEGDTVGAVLLLSRDDKTRMGTVELKVAETAAGFVGKQMEQ